jgi:2-polyprenyl-3-methyl-5-hydroxy-6-metoxy-1,4-benzoquinol methylase
MEALGLAIERLEVAWLPVELVRGELHAYEPLRVDQFLDMLTVAREVAPGSRYLEVGPGIGTKLLVVAALGLDAHGIENRAQYIGTARFLLDQPPQTFEPPTVELADARGWERYREFDIVYAYRPVRGEEGQVAFERHLTEQMRPGAVLLNPCRPRISADWSPTDHRWVWVR